MAKRRMVQSNLIKNSIAAYFAAVEIHNKPGIAYRYETTTLLIMNAWELALKAYIKKYIKKRSIYTADGHTISLDKALDYVSQHRNAEKKNSFSAVRKNIEEIEYYRNGITHFYCEELEPYIFMLTAKSALNYVEFIKEYFGKDIMSDDGLFILPLGFKLPFSPVDFLSGTIAKYAASADAQEFISRIIKATKELDEIGVDDSIVLGFDVFLQSVKKASNSDILVAIAPLEQAKATVAKMRKITLSPDGHEIIGMSDGEFRQIWKYSHAELLGLCKANIPNFKQGKIFNMAKRSFANDPVCVYDRKLDSRNPKSASQKFYTDEALKRVIEFYSSIENGHEL